MTDDQAESETETGRVNVGNPNLPPAVTNEKLARMQGFTTEPDATSEERHYKAMTIKEAARRLNGDRDQWTVQIVDETPNAYIDAVHIDHAAFDQYTGVSIEYEPTENGYAVIHPTPTDIFTVERGVVLDVALRVAVQVANAEHSNVTPSRREQAAKAVAFTRRKTAKALRTLPGAIRMAADAMEPALRRAADVIEP